MFHLLVFLDVYFYLYTFYCWGFVRVILGVAFGLFAPKFWEVVRT